MSDSIFTRFELNILYNEIFQTLAFPPPVFPVLRRDIFCFPTIIQDLLGNPEYQFQTEFELEEYSDVISNYLTEYSDSLYHETSKEDLASIRWNAKKTHERDSIGSMSTQDSDENRQGDLIEFFKGIKKCIKLYCLGVGELLNESNDLLNLYCNYWENFSFSIKRINSLFLPVTEMINEFYEMRYGGSNGCPRINFMKIMTGIWRKKVFERCKERILNEVVNEIYKLRGEELQYGNIIQSKRICESLLDLSLNELNIFFKNHSLLALEGPYQYIHMGVLEHLKEYYQAFNVNYAKEEEIISNIFINVTLREARRVYCKIIGQITSNLEMIIESENYEKNDDDLMLEWRAQCLGINTCQNSEDLWKFSQCREDKLIDILNHLQSYSECNC